MVIDNLDFMNIAIAPNETNTPLVVDPDAVLARSVPSQRLQPVTGRLAYILQPLGNVQCPQFALSNTGNLGGKAFRHVAPEDDARRFSTEAFYHTSRVSRRRLSEQGLSRARYPRANSKYPNALTVADHPGPTSVDVSSSVTIAGPWILAPCASPARANTAQSDTAPLTVSRTFCT